MTAGRTSVDRLARVLAGLQRDVRDLQTKPQIGYSSYEGTLNNYDPVTGKLRAVVGPIGAVPVNGPTPPRPAAPLVSKVAGGLAVRWTGLFADGAIIPEDFSRVEVHVMDGPDVYTGSAAFLRGTIESPRGGDVVVVPLAVEPKYVILVARSTSGVASAPSDMVQATPGSVITDAERDALYNEIDRINSEVIASEGRVDTALADAAAAMAEARDKNRILFGETPPAGTDWDNDDLWFEGDSRRPNRWDAATSTWQPAPLGGQALQSGAVGSEQLAPKAVESANIADFAVQVTQLQSNKHFLY